MHVLLLILLAGEIVVAVRGVWSLDASSSAAGGSVTLWALGGILVLPLLALARLLRVAPRPRAYARVAAASFTFFAGLLPVTALMALFAVLASNKSQFAWLAYLYGLLAGLLASGIVAIVAYRSGPRSEARASWFASVAMPIGYVVAAHVAVVVAAHVDEASVERRANNARRAHEALLTINRCASTVRAAQSSYPPSLAALGPQGTRCLDAKLAEGSSPGYRVEYTPGLPDPSGRVSVYSLCASPIAYPRSGLTTLATHEASEWVSENGDARSPLAYRCERAWETAPDFGRSLLPTRHCVIAYARSHPQLGYPASLDDLAQLPCTPGERTTYRPGPPNARGVRDRFELHVGGDHQGQPAGFRLDETGVIRVAVDREATRDDPPLEELRAQAAAEQKRVAEAKAAEAERSHLACKAGEMAACDTYAEYVFFETNRIDEAIELWKRACAGGQRRACVSSLPVNREAFHLARELRHRCRNRDAKACEGMQKLADDPSDESARRLRDAYR